MPHIQEVNQGTSLGMTTPFLARFNGRFVEIKGTLREIKTI